MLRVAVVAALASEYCRSCVDCEKKSRKCADQSDRRSVTSAAMSFNLCLAAVVLLACHTIEVDSFQQRGMTRYSTLSLCKMRVFMNAHGDWDLDRAIVALDKYNTAYITRMKEGRKEGLSPQTVEFRRIQAVGGDTIKTEREELRHASLQIVASAEEVVLGIMADSVSSGINVLKKYVTGLALPRGVIRAVGTNGDEVPIESLKDSPVYLKYNSSDSGDAYMKAYDGGYIGVILQPRLKEDDEDAFRQWGDLPLPLF